MDIFEIPEVKRQGPGKIEGIGKKNEEGNFFRKFRALFFTGIGGEYLVPGILFVFISAGHQIDDQ